MPNYPDVTALSELLRKQAFYNAGGEDENPVDRTNKILGSIATGAQTGIAIRKSQEDIISSTLAREAKKLEMRKITRELTPENELGVGTPSPLVAGTSTSTPSQTAGTEPITSTVTQRLKNVGGGFTIDENLKRAEIYQKLNPKQGYLRTIDKQTGKEVQPPVPLTAGTGDIIREVGTDINLGEKENQFWEKQWTDLINKNDPATGTSRSAIGIVGRANLQANRALNTLKNPTVTKQDAGNVMADIAGIYQGGAPTQFGMSEQGYKTLYGRIQELRQMASGNPQDALPDNIKQHMIETINQLKKANQDILGNRLNTLEKTRTNLIKRYPEAWQEFKTSVIGGIEPSTEKTSPPMFADPAKQARYEAWKANHP